MADKTFPGAGGGDNCIREAVCIHTKKIMDSCRDKDCIEDLKVYPTVTSQALIETAFSVRPRSAKLLYVDINVEEMAFNKGCYTVDVTYFYKVTGETFPGACHICGLAMFEKRVVLYGSEGAAKVFSSKTGKLNCGQSLPIAVVEAVDPLALSMRITDCAPPPLCDVPKRDIPEDIMRFFDDELIITDVRKQLFVTLGQFSIIRLERDAQLLMPAYDYCIPDKECAGTEEDPCTMFSRIAFPLDDFFPPGGCASKCTEDAGQRPKKANC